MGVPVFLRSGASENHTGDIRAGLRSGFAHFVQVATIPFTVDVIGVGAIVSLRGGKQRVTPVNIDLVGVRAGPIQFDRVVVGSFRCQPGEWGWG